MFTYIYINKYILMKFSMRVFMASLYNDISKSSACLNCRFEWTRLIYRQYFWFLLFCFIYKLPPIFCFCFSLYLFGGKSHNFFWLQIGNNNGTELGQDSKDNKHRRANIVWWRENLHQHAIGVYRQINQWANYCKHRERAERPSHLPLSLST